MLKVYRTALYERVSKEDGDDEASESIRVQRRMLEDYCRDHKELIPVRHYSDDGYTGVKFARPAFMELMADIEEGRIDCVAVKDLSRFGRDLTGVGEYLERVFPRLGIRFIAVNDRVDSEDGPYNMTLPLANLMNAQYAMDISQKVRSALESRRKAGNYLCPSAPYGYDKDERHPGRLTPNGDAGTVRLIYEMYLSGRGKTAIASELNGRGVPSPGASRAASGFYKKAVPDTKNWTWSVFSVDKLLRNPVYAGDAPTGKTYRKGTHGKVRLRPQREWGIVRDTHQAIIRREMWEAVQRRLDERGKGGAFQGAGGLFSGLVFCGSCGGRMKLTNHHGRREYFCARYKSGGPAACGSHSIGEEALSRIVLEDINRLIANVDIRALCGRHIEELERRRREDAAKLDNRLAALTRDKQSAYENYRSGMTSKDEFIGVRAALEQKIEEARRNADTLHNKGAHAVEWLKRLAERGRLAELDKETVRAVLERITVCG